MIANKFRNIWLYSPFQKKGQMFDVFIGTFAATSHCRVIPSQYLWRGAPLENTPGRLGTLLLVEQQLLGFSLGRFERKGVKEGVRM